MNDRPCATVWFVLLSALLGVALAFSVLSARQDLLRAERSDAPPHVTKRWTMKHSNWSAYDVDVVDTSGVCLYIAHNGGIAAMAKTALPQGTGCE